jgi:hypothetical protein
VPRSSKTRDLFQLKHCAPPSFGLYLAKQHIDMCESRYTTKCSAKSPGHGLYEARPTWPISLCSSMWPWTSVNGLRPTRIANGYRALVSCYLSVTLSPELGNETAPTLTETSVPVQLLWCFPLSSRAQVRPVRALFLYRVFVPLQAQCAASAQQVSNPSTSHSGLHTSVLAHSRQTYRHGASRLKALRILKGIVA